MKPSILSPEQQDALIVAEAEAKKFKLPETWREGRSEISGITIDSEHTVDRDDAIWFEPTANGYDMQVSIADTSYVPTASAIADYAEKMGETRYLRSRQIPMIPARLSEHKLSLLETKESPVLAAAISLDAAYNLQDIQLRRGIIKPYRITYPEVAKLTHGEGDETLVDIFRAYEQFALDMLRARQNRGALAYYNLDQGLMTNEDGMPIALHAGVEHSGELIVQEFMIATNAAVANYGIAHNIPLIYRNHHMARDFNVQEVVELLQTGEVGKLQDMRRTMGRAQYGTVPEGHDALKLPAYVHFTSPLRRFSDFVNHANLSAHFDGRPYPYPPERIAAIAERLNGIQTEIAERVSAPYKEQDRTVSARRLGTTAATLLALEDGKFFRVIKAANANRLMSEGLREAVEAKLGNGTLANRDLGELLFADIPGEEHAGLIQQLLGYLKTNTHLAVMILMEAEAQQRITDIAYQYTNTPNGFGCTAQFVRAGIMYEATMEATNKKVAQQRAVVTALGRCFGAEISFEDAIAMQAQSARPESTALELTGSPKNILNEYFQRKRLNLPEFTTRQIWQGAGEAVYESKVRVHGVEYVGHGRKIKDAETEAARAAVEGLRDTLMAEMAPGKLSQPELPTDAVSILMQRSQRLRFSMPNYIFSQTGPSHKPTFACVLEVPDATNTLRRFEGSGTSKAIARNDAAQKALAELKG